MAYSGEITKADKEFLIAIVEDSVKCGYINEPKQWRGRNVEYYEDPDSLYTPIGTVFCCIGSGGKDNDKFAVVLAVIFFVFSFFIGLFYTANSLQSAVQAERDLKHAKAEVENSTTLEPVEDLQPTFSQSYPSPYPPPYPGNPPSESPEYTASLSTAIRRNSPQYYRPTSSYNPAHRVTSPLDSDQTFPLQEDDVPVKPIVYRVITSEVTELYKDAALLLKGRREERFATSASQALMTVGAGLMTAALLFTLIADANLIIVAIGVAGGGFIVMGSMAFFVKKCLINTRGAQKAAEHISKAIFYKPFGAGTL